MYTGRCVRKRGALQKNERRRVFVYLHTLLKDVVFTPELQDLFFFFSKRELG